MNLKTECCILNGGDGSWAFEPLADALSQHIGIDVSPIPRRFNYLLHYESPSSLERNQLFIPAEAIQIAADKRRQADLFRRDGVPCPETHLLSSPADAIGHVRARTDKEWCLKFPSGCGASGHQLLTAETVIPDSWPLPLVVQEFIRMEDPAVHRIYCAGGKLFGWVSRRFPEGKPKVPWVAHARGARYFAESAAPLEAVAAATLALNACGLADSFGAVDLLPKPDGNWVVLEVGTDGLFNHVDRDLGQPQLESMIYEKIAKAFWERAETSLS